MTMERFSSSACIWSTIGILTLLVIVTLLTKSFAFYILTSIVLAFSIVIPSLTNNKTKLMIVLMVIAFIQTILMSMVTQNSAYLVWDLKAQDNVASYIVREGYIPRPLGGIYRPEYVSYPAGYIVWAVLSEITSIPTNLLMVSPILTYALYIVFLWVTLNILNDVNKEYRPLVIALLGSAFIVLYKLPNIFIYQNYGRVLLLTSTYLLYKTLLGKKLKAEALLVILIFIATLVFSHSESSIAYLVIVTGLLADAFEKQRSISSISNTILIIFAVTFAVFALYHFWGALYFATTLIGMLKNTLTYLLSSPEEGLTVKLAKYTPIDYTPIELMFFGSSLILTALTALMLFLLGIIMYLKYKKLMLYLGPLTLIGFSFVLLFWFSPYKSDISFKFITALSTAIALSFIELSNEAKHPSNHSSKRLRELKDVLIICVAIIIVAGFSEYSYRGEFSSNSPAYYNFALHLESSGLSKFLTNTQGRYVIIDSPSFPYFFIRDYIDPRFGIPYSVVAVEPEVTYYNFHLINGLMMPRFILILQKASLVNTSILPYGEVIIGESESLMRFERVSVVYTTGIVSIGEVVG
ncbi:MAG: hypothetical protein LM583_04560 [Desulfurococcaceae archaeon]|nr:hypothetical protein [Desulfurococcaceae archaeon]